MRASLIHKLYYTWTGWPQEGSRFPPDPGAIFVGNLSERWAADGIAFRSRDWSPAQIQIACEVEPTVAPMLFTARIKGRLQHALREAGPPVAFSRKVGMRAIGENVTSVVLDYLRAQLEHVDLADDRYRDRLAAAAITHPAVDLSQPTETDSGRYWFNLHLVLVTDARYRVGREDALPKLPAAVAGWAAATKCALRALAVMPDHLHLALRGNIASTPAELAESCRRALNREVGCVLYSERMYVGTFSEYSLQVLRH